MGKFNFKKIYILIFTFFLSIICLIYVKILKNKNFININLNEKHVWAFYVPIWGNPIFDGNYTGWKRKKNKYMPKYIEPPFQMSSKLFPQLGLYSTNDPSLLRQHFNMISEIGIDGLIIQWNGINRTDDSALDINGRTENIINLILNISLEFNIKIGIQLQLYEHRSNSSVYDDLNYIFENFSNHKSYLKFENKPIIFIYDQHETENIFSSIYLHRIKQKPFYLFGSFVQNSNIISAMENGFDGVYTYFASENLKVSSKHSNWNSLKDYCIERGMYFIPTVGPGYDDSNWNDWGHESKRSRERGSHYERMWQSANNNHQNIILINSFNSWAEGTQIEPAINKNGFEFNEERWTNKNGKSNDFLEITLRWVKLFKNVSSI